MGERRGRWERGGGEEERERGGEGEVGRERGRESYQFIILYVILVSKPITLFKTWLL